MRVLYRPLAMYRLTLSLFAVLIAAPPALARGPTPEEIGRATRFVQSIRKVYDEGLTLGLEMDAAKEYIDSFQAAEIDPEEFTAALDPFLDSMRDAIDDFQARYPRAPAPPGIGSIKHQRSMARFAQMVVGFGRRLHRQLDALHDLRGAALIGDEIAYDIATADSMALVGEKILAENIVLETSLVAVAPDHPRQGLVGAIIGGNQAAAVAARVVEAALRGDDFDAGEFAVDVETGLRDAGRAIVSGERAARKMLKNLEGKFATTEADRYEARFTGEMVRAYERAFLIERAILETERGLLDYLRAVNAGEEDADAALDDMADFQFDLDELIGQRLAERDIRLEMTANFARTLQTLQN